MISVKSIQNVIYSDYDEVWAIVRYMKHPNDNIKQVPELSPSPELFNIYQLLKQEHQWDYYTFKKCYVPNFLKEMKSQAARDALNKLYQLDKAGKHICIVCFCPEELTCHRSIVAGLLQGVKANVKTENDYDYSDYYKLWNSISDDGRYIHPEYDLT